MSIRVEFFGIARQRAGRAHIELPVSGPVRLGAVLELLAEKCPHFAAGCMQGHQLAPGYVANIDGQQFIHDPDKQLADNACLLILSADAGG